MTSIEKAEKLLAVLENRNNEDLTINEVLFPMSSDVEKLNRLTAMGEMNLAVLILKHFLENRNFDIDVSSSGVTKREILDKFHFIKSELERIILFE